MKKILEITIILILLLSIFSIAFAETEELLIGSIEINEEILLKIEVLSENGIIMRAAPTESSKEILTIPKGTDLLGHPIKGSETSRLWAYVQYEEKEGWINCQNNEVGHTYPVDSDVLIIYDTPIYKDLSYKDEIGSIPAYTVINSKKMLSLDFSNAFADDEWKKAFKYNEKQINKLNYVEYNGIYGYANIDKYGINNEGKYTVEVEPTQLYKNPSDDSEVLIENIPVGTKLDYSYYSDVGRVESTKWRKGVWIYTKYEDKEGWVPTVDEEYLSQKNQIMELFNERSENNQASQSNINKNIIIISVASVVLVVLIVLLIIVKKKLK